MSSPHSILVIGGGKIGSVVAALLAQATGALRYQVTVADRSAEQLAELKRENPAAAIETLVLDVHDPAQLRTALHGKFAVLSAAPYHLTVKVAEAARAAGVHYLDLTEDVASTRRIRELAEGATSALIPQCGLAPGFISIVAADLARRFDSLDSVRMRVGALPAYPSNALNYNLTWSTEGVINEYCEPCEAIVDGRITSVPALEEREEFSLDGVLYEAFNTSGGLGTLCESLAGRVRTLNYRTIRYPGHAAIMKALLHDLRLKDRREVLKDILENALPATLQDVVIVFVTVSGMKDGHLQQETYARKIYSQVLGGRLRSAIQVTTASSLCAMLDLLAEGHLPASGFVRQEDLSLASFLANRFGRVYGAQELARAA
ncbi:saccharopine dehydrogenase family protein [Piscinibacter sp. HJYY11]|uniref:saccharopine dehydrogenase family protein n=1 Tax=Piscinibacter sp. HJYY11 TaxID=2801333 RepID=UPI00191D951F|nr:saccharopine dehydrogenase family protein [Piscinibacter sp. HJYY11]MBL0728513.1 saccharopine dehydrogenase family protein [Piscinibacter sp. HJYY11]